MTVVRIVVILAALYVIIPYARCLLKRLICMLRIRRICRQKGFEIRRTHPLWFLGSRYGRRCDCFILAGGTVFGVKFFGCLRGLKALIFSGYGQYFFRPLNNFPLFQIDFFDTGHHPLPDYDFDRRLSPEWRDRPMRRFLLINPIPLEVRMQPASGAESISGPGDMVDGMEIASLSHLLRLLDNAG